MKRFKLRKMRFDEVSMVPSGDNPPADIVLAKSDGDKTHGHPSGANTLKLSNPKEVVVGDGNDVISKDDLPAEVVEYIDALENKVDDQSVTIERLQKDDAPGGDDEDLDSLIQALVDEGIIEEGDASTDLVKSDPVVRGLIAKVEQAESIAKAERDERLRRDYIAKAEGYTMLSTDADQFGAILKSVDENLDAETATALREVLDRAQGALDAAKLFGELGSSQVAKTSGRLDAAAQEIRKSDPSLTHEQAVAKALDNDPALYEEA